MFSPHQHKPGTTTTHHHLHHCTTSQKQTYSSCAGPQPRSSRGKETETRKEGTTGGRGKTRNEEEQGKKKRRWRRASAGKVSTTETFSVDVTSFEENKLPPWSTRTRTLIWFHQIQYEARADLPSPAESSERRARPRVLQTLQARLCWKKRKRILEPTALKKQGIWALRRRTRNEGGNMSLWGKGQEPPKRKEEEVKTLQRKSRINTTPKTMRKQKHKKERNGSKRKTDEEKVKGVTIDSLRLAGSWKTPPSLNCPRHGTGERQPGPMDRGERERWMSEHTAFRKFKQTKLILQFPPL